MPILAIEEGTESMEFVVLMVDASNLDDLVDEFKSKIASSSKSVGLLLTSETNSGSGSARILTFNVDSRSKAMESAGEAARVALTVATRWARPHSYYYFGRDGSPPYVASVIFNLEEKGQSQVTISVSGGDSNYPSTDAELKVIDRFTNSVIAVAKGVKTIYNATWIYDDDEKIREKAVFGLEHVDAEMALKPLTNLLRHDSSDTVREKAAQSLGRIGTPEATEVLQNALNSYIHGDRSRHGVAAACAQSLGAMRDKGSLESLRELLEIFEKKQLSAQARSVKEAIYRIQYGKDPTETICMVCNEPVEEGAELLQCPACKGVAHRDQLLEWLHVKDYCPKCHEHIDENSFRRTGPAHLPLNARAKKHSGRKVH